MKSQVELKLQKIADIWNHYILEYSFCNNRIRYDSDAKTNYFGDILGYFQDTFDLVFKEKQVNDFNDSFVRNISLLQAIYIHQDFITELLLLFKCNISKGDLKKDPNYCLNRDIRNELIGHPIRKETKGNRLISSTSFAYHNEKDKLKYLRYHKDNNFKFEIMTFNYSDIIQRHEDFLNYYFDVILCKLKEVLNDFVKKINEIEKIIAKQNFETILKVTSIFFESVFKNNFISDVESLKLIYIKRTLHNRYQNHIDLFINNLKEYLVETKLNILYLFEPIKNQITVNYSKTKDSISYHYEIGKLATRKDEDFYFQFASSVLKDKCNKNKIILEELNHMGKNLDNDIEYYCSLDLIRTELKVI